MDGGDARAAGNPVQRDSDLLVRVGETEGLLRGALKLITTLREDNDELRREQVKLRSELARLRGTSRGFLREVMERADEQGLPPLEPSWDDPPDEPPLPPRPIVPPPR